MSSSEALSPVPHTLLLRRAQSISDSRSVRKQTRQTRSILTENLCRSDIINITSITFQIQTQCFRQKPESVHREDQICGLSRGGPVERVMGVWGGYEAGMCVRRRL